MAWAKNGSTTLSSAGDTITVSSLTANKTNLFLSHTFASGNTATYFYFNNDGSSGNYARRQSENGGADGTGINQNNVVYDTGGNAHDKFSITYVVGVSSKEKLSIGFGINRNTAGAGNAPVRGEFVWKWANTSDTINRIDDDTSAQTGTYAIDTNLSALGSELTPSAIAPETNSIFIETDTANRWWFNGSNWYLSPSYIDDFSTDNWSDSTSYMGVSNGTLNITTRGATTNDSTSYDLQNYFGVNADNEKWVLRFKMKFNTSFFNDGAGGTMLWVGLSDKNNTAGARTTTQDFIGINTAYYTSGIKFSSCDFNDSLLGWSTALGTEQDQNIALSVSQYYYIEIKRTSATTYETGIYSDSNYLNALHTYTSGSTSSSVTNLRYIVCRNYNQQTLANSCSVTIDDMYFWNGVSSVQQ